MAGTLVQAGPWAGQEAQFNNQAPHLSTNKGFDIRRARVGVRGQGHPLNGKVNYFFLAEFGSNGITWLNSGDGHALIDHASITLNYIPGARIRAGLFKVPMSEEMMQAIHVFDYINFTNFGFQQLLERFFDGDGSGTFHNGGGNADSGIVNVPNGPIGAVRDQGIQVFDAFKTGSWETSYALMVGNGNGINRADNNTSLDTYIYLSTEKVFAGRGPRVQSLKMYAWSLSGKRELTTEDAIGKGTYDRKRSGLGVTYRKGPYRAAAEYLRADGMIFTGSDGAGKVGTPSAAGVISSLNVAPEEKANAYYVHFGYAVNHNLELDIRYDTMNRATETTGGERKFTTTTLGMQWFFDLKNRFTINYELRDAKAPGFASGAGPNLVLDSLDNRLSLQLTSIF